MEEKLFGGFLHVCKNIKLLLSGWLLEHQNQDLMDKYTDVIMVLMHFQILENVK